MLNTPRSRLTLFWERQLAVGAFHTVRKGDWEKNDPEDRRAVVRLTRLRKSSSPGFKEAITAKDDKIKEEGGITSKHLWVGVGHKETKTKRNLTQLTFTVWANWNEAKSKCLFSNSAKQPQSEHWASRDSVISQGVKFTSFKRACRHKQSTYPPWKWPLVYTMWTGCCCCCCCPVRDGLVTRQNRKFQPRRTRGWWLSVQSFNVAKSNKDEKIMLKANEQHFVDA